MTEKLGVGVVGCGSVAQNAYMPLIASLRSRGEVGYVAVTDSQPLRVSEIASQYAVDTQHESVDALLRDESVQVVLILTSMVVHCDLAIRALKAGKHVLVEKPMATNLEDARTLLSVAQASARHLVCAPHVLLSPDFQEMYRRVHEGVIGRPILARARYGWEGPDWSEWFYAPGGGPLFDLGVYNVTSLTALLGPVSKVTCLATTSQETRIVRGKEIQVQTPDTFQLSLQHRDGALSAITTAFGMQKYRGPAIEVYGLDGTIQMLGDDWAPTGVEHWSNEAGAWQLLESRSLYWPWTDGLSHLVNCVRQGKQPYTRPDQAFHVLDIMLSSLKSAETGTTQHVESTFTPPPPMERAARRSAHLVHDRTHEDAQH